MTPSRHEAGIVNPSRQDAPGGPAIVRITAYLEMTLAMVLFGSMIVAGKILAVAFPVMLTSAARLAVSAAVLIPFAIIRLGAMPALSRPDALFVALHAFCGQVLFYVFLLYGLRFTTAANAGVVIAALPAVTALLAVFLLRERMTARTAAAALIASAGVVALRALDTARVTGWQEIIGLGLAFLAVVADGAAIVLAKRISVSVSSLVVAAYAALFGLVLLVPFVIYDASTSEVADIDMRGIASILYFGLFATALPSYLWLSGIRKVTGGSAGILTSVLPLSAVALSYLVLGEPIRASHLIGLVAVLAAIGLITWPAPNSKSPRSCSRRSG